MTWRMSQAGTCGEQHLTCTNKASRWSQTTTVVCMVSAMSASLLRQLISRGYTMHITALVSSSYLRQRLLVAAPFKHLLAATRLLNMPWNIALTNSTACRLLISTFYFIAIWKRDNQPIWQSGKQTRIDHFQPVVMEAENVLKLAITCRFC